MAGGRLVGIFTERDAALKLALLDFAPAQPFVEIADGGIRGHYPEGEADLVGLPPDQPCKIGTALVRNGQVPLLGQPCRRIDFDAGALLTDVTHHAIRRHAAPGNVGNAAIEHLFAHALAPVQHRKSSK